jgi:hypothetical protein
MIHELHELLEHAARRIRKLRFWSALAVCWTCWAFAGGLALLLAERVRVAWDWRQTASWIAAGALVSAFVCWRVASRSARSPRAVARRIEASYPELGAMLLSAVEQAPAPRYKQLGYLQSTVVRGAVEHGRQHNWADATSAWGLRLVQVAQFAALGGLVALCFALANRDGAFSRRGGDDADEPLLPAGAYDIRIEPGNAEVERGAPLLVIAKFHGAVPPEATLIVREAPRGRDAARQRVKSRDEATRAMTRSLDDPQFVGRVPMVEHELTYAVEYAGRRTPFYRVTIFDYPELMRADAHLTFPEFTRLEPKVVEDVRRITAVEGTKATLKFRLNADVADARLIERGGEEVALRRAAGEQPIYETAFTLGGSRRFKLHLLDAAGRKNKFPPDIALDATPNHPPTIKLTRPGRDVRVSPLEEMTIAAEATDDFGLVGYGISYSHGGREPKEVPLTAQAAPDAPAKTAKLSHLVDFESLAARPDQLVSYHVWAEDIGPDGQRRRTMSDMFFAEVRPFDEIFRAGEQPAAQPQGQAGAQPGGAGQQAEKLAELQKEIINATWTLVRREKAAAPSAQLSDDARAVEQSQRQAIEQLGELGQRLSDRRSAQFLNEARRHMEQSAERLARAIADNAAAPLGSALSAQQGGYQALLKLRAHEFDVSRGAQQQGGGGGGGSSGPSQRQLQQLQLSANENRYETQSQARAPSAGSQQRLDESRRLLDRLRELGRRQEDLNERLRELQSAMHAAQNEQQRREIERQLKRLREQQREILRDADNVQGDMESSANRDQMQQSREQLDEARSRVQDASQALDEGRLGDAVSQGARAGDELNTLRDQFRRQTADRFTDQMRKLRAAGRELDERQQKISEELARQDAQRGRSLRDSAPREELSQAIRQQQKQLTETLEQMQQIVGEAEEPEPILARELYDAVGETGRQKTVEALDMARQLAEAGATRDAAETMRQADRGVGELRKRLDRAAESVLGDETEALRRASKQLRDLAEQVDQEISAGRGEPRDAGEGRPGGPENSRRPADAAGASDRGENRQLDERQAGGSPAVGPPEAATDRRPASGQGAGDANQNSADANASNGGSESGEQLLRDEGNSGANDRPPEGREGGERPGGGEQPGGRPGGARAENRRGNLEDLFGGDGGGRGGAGNVITGEDFREWADRMRDVEDMIDRPDLSAEVARIRDRAQEARLEYKRHSRVPDWAKLHDMVTEPLRELQARIDDEIRRHQSPDALAPVDRDAPPSEFTDQIRLYYQRLGSGE